jgi:hypothetical protein
MAGRQAIARTAVALAAMLLALPTGADSIEGASEVPVPQPAAPSAGQSAAQSAFERHAKSWMADLERSEAENRRKAPVYSVASEAVIRFDGYGDDYEIQVKPTKSAQTPFVGILRYKEHTYTCLRDDETRCTVTRSVPVSEIFSFRNGRWTY